MDWCEDRRKIFFSRMYKREVFFLQNVLVSLIYTTFRKLNIKTYVSKISNIL